MCLPAPPDDPERYRLKERNLADLWRPYHAAGALRLVLRSPPPKPERCSAQASVTCASTPTAEPLQR